MNYRRNGRPYYSQQYAWVANSRFNIPLSFLDSAIADFHRPVIDHFVLEFDYDITTGGGTPFVPEDQARVFQDVFLKDKLGERVDMRGVELRLVNIALYGDAYEDPAQIAAATANATGRIFLKIPGEVPYKTRRRTDSAIPVKEMISKGSLDIRACVATVVTGVTVNSGNYRVYAWVREQVAPEAKSRIRWRGEDATLIADNYVIDGQLVLAAFINQITPGPSYTNLFATLTEVDSSDLGYSDINQLYLREIYRGEARGIFATDPLEAGTAWPLFWPRYEQSLADLPELRTLHVRFNAAPPANTRLVTGVVTDRDPASVANMLGALDTKAATNALASNGVIAGTDKEWKTADPLLRGRLALRLKK